MSGWLSASNLYVTVGTLVYNLWGKFKNRFYPGMHMTLSFWDSLLMESDAYQLSSIMKTSVEKTKAQKRPHNSLYVTFLQDIKLWGNISNTFVFSSHSCLYMLLDSDQTRRGYSIFTELKGNSDDQQPQKKILFDVITVQKGYRSTAG